jgi:hypothetical protein
MDKNEALQNLWNVHRKILSKRGVDLSDVLKRWAVQQEERLASSGARSDFRELCENGCVPEILAILVAFLRWSQELEDFWTKIYGSPSDRRRVSKSLEKTAELVESLFSFSIRLEDEELISKFEEMGRISPARLASELKMYARLLNFVDSFPRETEMRSLADFGMFSLSEYVKQATGRFRDRNVSGLIAAAIGPTDYNEVAHRMWRSRNFKRMSAHFQKLSELLSGVHALATVET